VTDCHRSNTTAISTIEFFSGFGLPVVVESTFLQVFLHNFGASRTMIGLIPVVFLLSLAVFSFISGYISIKLSMTKYYIAAMRMIAATSILICGLKILNTTESDQIVVTFFVSYTFFCIFVALSHPLWQNLLVKLFSENYSITALGIIMISQSTAKLCGSFVLALVLKKSGFSNVSSAKIFIFVGIVILAASMFFIRVKENPYIKKKNKKKSLLHDHAHLLKDVLKNKNFLWFLGSDLEYYSLITVFSFYAKYAVEHHGIPPSIASGYFVAFSYTGGIVANIIFGVLGMFSIRNKLIFSKIGFILAIFFLCVGKSAAIFFVVSLLIGVSRSIRMLAFPPAIKKLSGEKDSTLYFSVAPILTLPFAIGLPLINGRFLDKYAYLGSISYKLVFASMGIIVIASLFMLLKTNFETNAITNSPIRE